MSYADVEAPVRILLVEDEPLIRMMTSEALEDEGFCVVEAVDAAEALGQLEASPGTHLIVTDVRMPGKIDGIELAELVAQRWPDIRIIIVSGHARPSTASLPKGAIFLNKPYQPSQLVKVIGGFLPSLG